MALMNAPALTIKSETSMPAHESCLIEIDICHPVPERLMLLQATAM
jgi:hypothetical protein